MLKVSWSHLAGVTTIVVVACAIVMFPLDRPNDLACWPIPEAD